MTYREFTDHMKAIATGQTWCIRGDQDIVPMLHMVRNDGEGHNVVTIPVEGAWLEAPRAQMVDQLVLPFMDVYRPHYVAWTFSGHRGSADGEFDHETVVAVCIERERHETWLARLVRHDNQASLGAWRTWPANQQEGLLLTPIQEALR